MRSCDIAKKKTFHLLCDDSTACGVRMVITNAIDDIGMVGWDGSAFTFRLTTIPRLVTCSRCNRAIGDAS